LKSYPTAQTEKPGETTKTRTSKAGTSTDSDVHCANAWEQNKTGRGFTLIELIVVIAVVSLLLGLAIPTISSISRNNLTSFASNLAEVIRHGRNQAIMTARPWEVELDLDETVALARPVRGEGMHLKRSAHGDVRITSIRFPDRKKNRLEKGEKITSKKALLRIMQRGLVEPAEILLTDGDRTLSLHVVPFTGRLRLTARHAEKTRGKEF
jgi:type II secretion system protein H